MHRLYNHNNTPPLHQDYTYMSPWTLSTLNYLWTKATTVMDHLMMPRPLWNIPCPPWTHIPTSSWEHRRTLSIILLRRRWTWISILPRDLDLTTADRDSMTVATCLESHLLSTTLLRRKRECRTVILRSWTKKTRKTGRKTTPPTTKSEHHLNLSRVQHRSNYSLKRIKISACGVTASMDTRCCSMGLLRSLRS